MISKAAISVLIGASALLAADFWQNKQPSEWSEKDVKRLLTKSPWARLVSISMGSPGADIGGSGGPRGAAAAGGDISSFGGDMGGGGGRRGGGGGGMGGGGMPALEILVRFESAAPLLAVAEKGDSKAAAKIAEWTREFYVVTATGMGGMLAGAGAPSQGANSQIAHRLGSVTSLKVKGKDPIAPASVAMIPAPEGGPVVAFLFPRASAIVLEDKDVSFETKLGPMDVKTRFALKDMVYQGKLEL